MSEYSEYQLPRLFDDFGQAWIRISCNISSSSGSVLLLSLSNCTLGIKKQSKVTGSKLLFLLCQLKLSFCYVLQFWHLLAPRERFAVRRRNVGFLGEESFFELKSHYFVLLSGQIEPVPALWLKHVPRIHMIKQSIIKETHFSMEYVIQHFRIHS